MSKYRNWIGFFYERLDRQILEAFRHRNARQTVAEQAYSKSSRVVQCRLARRQSGVGSPDERGRKTEALQYAAESRLQAD